MECTGEPERVIGLIAKCNDPLPRVMEFIDDNPDAFVLVALDEQLANRMRAMGSSMVEPYGEVLLVSNSPQRMIIYVPADEMEHRCKVVASAKVTGRGHNLPHQVIHLTDEDDWAARADTDFAQLGRTLLAELDGIGRPAEMDPVSFLKSAVWAADEDAAAEVFEFPSEGDTTFRVVIDGPLRTIIVVEPPEPGDEVGGQAAVGRAMPLGIVMWHEGKPAFVWTGGDPVSMGNAACAARLAGSPIDPKMLPPMLACAQTAVLNGMFYGWQVYKLG